MPGDVRKVMFQIGVGVKASVEIGRDQESMASDLYKGVRYFCLRGTRPEECTFNIHMGRMDSLPIYR